MLDLKLFAVTLFIFVIFYVYLSVNVIRQRRLHKIAVGDQNNMDLLRAIRAHANCGEYAPLIFLELFILVTLQANSTLMASLCVAVLIGRFAHAYSLTCLELKQPPRFWARGIGMMLTFLSLLIGALVILICTF